MAGIHGQRRGRGEGPTSPERLAARRRSAEAFRLRVDGLSWQSIGERLGVSHVSARRGALRWLREIAADGVAELREIEGARLDALQAAYWQRAVDGDLDAVAVILRVIAQRRALFGLDAAPKAPVNTEGEAVGPPIVQIVYEDRMGRLIPAPDAADTDEQQRH